MSELAPAPGSAPAAGDAGTGNGDAGTKDPGQQGTPPATNGDAGQAGFDPSKLKAEDVDKLFAERGDLLFQHPRFKELNEKAKQADKLKAAQDEAEKKALEEQGKWKELADKATQEASSVKDQLKQMTQNQSLMTEAQKAGVTDLDAALKLVDRSGISIDDNGQAVGVADAIKALVEAKPYLVGAKPQVKVGSPSNPANSNPNNPQVQQTADGKRIYKLSEIQDTKFYRENAADIRLAMKEGRTINDTGSAVGIAGGQGE